MPVPPCSARAYSSLGWFYSLAPENPKEGCEGGRGPSAVLLRRWSGASEHTAPALV